MGEGAIFAFRLFAFRLFVFLFSFYISYIKKCLFRVTNPRPGRTYECEDICRYKPCQVPRPTSLSIQSGNQTSTNPSTPLGENLDFWTKTIIILIMITMLLVNNNIICPPPQEGSNAGIQHHGGHLHHGGLPYAWGCHFFWP